MRCCIDCRTDASTTGIVDGVSKAPLLPRLSGPRGEGEANDWWHHVHGRHLRGCRKSGRRRRQPSRHRGQGKVRELLGMLLLLLALLLLLLVPKSTMRNPCSWARGKEKEACPSGVPAADSMVSTTPMGVACTPHNQHPTLLVQGNPPPHHPVLCGGGSPCMSRSRRLLLNIQPAWHY